MTFEHHTDVVHMAGVVATVFKRAYARLLPDFPGLKSTTGVTT